MARSVGEAAATGLESGFHIGQEIDAANERKRATAVQEMRQSDADQRANNEFRLRQDQDRRTANRQGVMDNLDLLDRQQKLIQSGQQDILSRATAAQTAGQDVNAADAAEYAKNDQLLKATRQKALDFFSRVQTGQLNLDDASPKDLYLNLTAATGMKPEQLQEMPKHIDDVTAGMQTNNTGLVVQGVNGLFQPQLQRGVGSPSPHGGTIERKEIIGLDPAVDNNHQPLPGKFMPRLRVYVKTDDGSTKYYDAPMTVDGGHGDDSRVAVIDIKNAMNYMGNMGVTANAMQRPDMVAKLIEGQKQAGGEADDYLAKLRAASAPPKPKGQAQERLDTIAAYAKKTNQSLDDAANDLQNKGVIPSGVKAGAANVQARLAAIDALDIPDDQKDQLRRDVALNGGGRTTGLIPQKGGTGSSPALGGIAAPIKPDDAVDFWAKAVIAGDKDWQVGLSRSKTGADLIEKVKRRVPEMAKELGLEPQDIGSARAQSAALGATLKDLTKRSAAVDMFSNKVEKDMQTFDSLLDKAAGSSPLLINKPLNALRRQFSDPDLAQLDLAAKQVGTEYERLITGGTLSVAQLHAGASEDAKKLINGDMPPKQARAVMDIMRREMVNAKSAAHEAETAVTNRYKGLGRGTGAAPAAGGSKYQEGQTATGPGGKKMVFRGGAWQPL